MRTLSGLLVFSEAAATLSFVEAGRRLGISSSAVGKALAKLESELGVRLLHRSTRCISLTQEGAAFHARCRRVLEELEDARVELAAAVARPQGRLRISLPTAGYHFLGPHLPAFVARYPEIVLELDYNDRIVDVIADGFDAVIRSVRPKDSRLVARKLGPFAFRVFAAPSYLAKHGTPRSSTDLVNHRCLMFRFETTGKLQPWTFKRSAFDTLPAAIICNNMEAVMRATVQGLGLSFMPDFIGRDGVAAGSLEVVLADQMAGARAFWLLWPPGSQLTAKLRAFIDFFGPRLSINA
jgi:DNA-binding transcriptional LysR family regulator